MRTLAKPSPRMVKRRNSPYKPHDRQAPIRQAIICHPVPLKPLPIPRWAAYRRRHSLDCPNLVDI